MSCLMKCLPSWQQIVHSETHCTANITMPRISDYHESVRFSLHPPLAHRTVCLTDEPEVDACFVEAMPAAGKAAHLLAFNKVREADRAVRDRILGHSSCGAPKPQGRESADVRGPEPPIHTELMERIQWVGIGTHPRHAPPSIQRVLALDSPQVHLCLAEPPLNDNGHLEVDHV